MHNLLHDMYDWAFNHQELPPRYTNALIVIGALLVVGIGVVWAFRHFRRAMWHHKRAGGRIGWTDARASRHPHHHLSGNWHRTRRNHRRRQCREHPALVEPDHR